MSGRIRRGWLSACSHANGRIGLGAATSGPGVPPPLSHTALKNVALLAALLNDRSYAEITA